MKSAKHNVTEDTLETREKSKVGSRMLITQL